MVLRMLQRLTDHYYYFTGQSLGHRKMHPADTLAYVVRRI